MKWTYSIQQKITAALLLFIVVLVVLLNNISERRNNTKFEKTVNTIYDDRLVVEQFIFQLSIKLNKLMDVLDNPNIESSAKISITHQIQQEIKDINFLYSKTVLTKEESVRFSEFKNQILALEQNLNRNKISEAKFIANNAVSQLHFLSEIQVKEAKIAFDQSKKILMSSKSSSQFEMALIIIIGLIIQVLIFASKSLTKPKDNSDFNMN